MNEDQRREPGLQVAVLLATYNGEKYLREQMDSLLNQTYSRFLCYIHDDGSEDHTREIIKEYVEKDPDRFVEIHGESCGGPKENFLFLLREAEADLYMFCDQDDVWIETKIEETLAAMSGLDMTVPACVYTDLYVVDSELKMICASFYDYTPWDPKNNAWKQLLLHNICVGCTMMINRCTRNRMLGFESQYFNMHDWMAALLASLEGNIYYIDHATILYRQHEDNQIGAKSAKKKSLFTKAYHAVLNIRKFVDGSREVVDLPRRRANELLALKDLNPDDKQFLTEMAGIEQRRKPERIKFYKEHAIFDYQKNTLVQLLFL